MNSAGAKKLTSITRRNRDSSAASKRPNAPTPALFTRQSRPPNSRRAIAKPRPRSESATRLYREPREVSAGAFETRCPSHVGGRDAAEGGGHERARDRPRSGGR